MKVLEGAGRGQLAVEREMQGGWTQGLQVTYDHTGCFYTVSLYLSLCDTMCASLSL